MKRTKLSIITFSFLALLLITSSSLAVELTVSYSYDSLNRLTSAQYDSAGDDALLSYQYDALGNITDYYIVLSDSDGDGLPNAIENASPCLNANDADTDDDGILDGTEDANHDGVVDIDETDPCNIDTDNDGIQDGTEVGKTLGDVGPDTALGTFQPDQDSLTTTDPLDNDSDNDGVLDGVEDKNHNGMVDPSETDPDAFSIFVTSIEPTFGIEGSEIAINGSNFGATQGTGYVTFFNNVIATNIISWSDTQIVCTVPAGTETGCLTVTTDNGTSNCSTFTVRSELGEGKMVFTSDRDGESDIWVKYIYEDGSTGIPVNLTSDLTGICSRPNWSPDGSKIVFESRSTGTDQIWVMNSDGSNKTQLTFLDGYYCRRPDWSPDASQIAFYRHFGIGTCSAYYTTQVCTMNADGSNMSCIPNINGHGEYWPTWSPSGDKILYDRDEGTCSNPKDIYIMNPDGTGKEPFYPPTGLDNDGNYQMNNDWGSHGKILFNEMTGSGTNQHLLIINDDGTGLYDITSPGSESIRGCCWAFDNNKVIYQATISGNSQLWMCNADGTDRVQLTFGTSNNNYADFVFNSPCLGDLDSDGDVDGTDMFIFSDAYANEDLAADLDNSGAVDADDLAAFAASFGRSGCLLSSYSLSDLEGTWYLRSLSTQKNDQEDNFGFDTGAFTFQSDGSFSGTMTDNEGTSWSESGTGSISEDGVATWSFDGGGSWSTLMNAGKDVMLGNYQDDDELGLDVFVKKSSSYSTSDLEGTWYFRSLCTQKNGQTDNFGYETGMFTVQGDCSFTGNLTDSDGDSWNENGTISVSGDGVVTWSVDSGGSLSAVINASKDVMVGDYQSPDEFILNVFVKKGSFYSISDLAGTWYLRSLGTQKDDHPDNFGYDTGVFTFQSDGSFTGTMTDNDGTSWSEIGTGSISADGVVTWSFDGGGSWSTVMNTGKDVMPGNYQDDDEFDLDILVRSLNNR